MVGLAEHSTKCFSFNPNILSFFVFLLRRYWSDHDKIFYISTPLLSVCRLLLLSASNVPLIATHPQVYKLSVTIDQADKPTPAKSICPCRRSVLGASITFSLPQQKLVFLVCRPVGFGYKRVDAKRCGACVMSVSKKVIDRWSAPSTAATAVSSTIITSAPVEYL